MSDERMVTITQERYNELMMEPDGLIRRVADLENQLGEAQRDAEQMRLILAAHGQGIDPDGYYVGTPGWRLRQLIAIADAAKGWQASSVGARGGAERRLSAAVDAYDAAGKGETDDEHDLDRLRENQHRAEEALKAELERRRIADRKRRCGAIYSPPGMRGFFVCHLDKGHDGNHASGDLHATEWPNEADSRAGQAGREVGRGA